MTTGSVATDLRWRTDIQALRGYAVLVVILFHSGLGAAPSGYVGVDLFFVLSGYLISGIATRAHAVGAFSARGFYLRRLRRLAPASLALLAAATLAALGLLTASGYQRFWPQLAGALGFATNIVLWRQINYFNDSAAFEPLLHMWSLAVEEQYYLLLPLAVALLPRRLWMPALLTATLASLAAYAWLYPRAPGATFYLLPTRAWEIGIGSIGALVADRGKTMRIGRVLRPAALLVLGIAPFLTPPLSLAHWIAPAVCVATLILLVAGQSRVSFHPLLRPLGVTGDMSYSLYLVHWPVFAFAHVIWLGAPVPAPVIIALIAAIALLAALLYHGVERPCRRSRMGGRSFCALLAAAGLMIATVGYAGLHYREARAGPLDLRGVTGLDLPGCDADARLFDGRCTQSARPQMLVWGDSFSQHIIPALTATTTHPLAQASKGGCAPLLDLAPVDLQGSLEWAKGCLQFNASVLRYIAENKTINVVVLSGRYQRYEEKGTQALLRDAAGRLRLTELPAGALVDVQRRTTSAIHALGRRVIIVGAPPQADFDVGQCWERRSQALPTVDRAPDCLVVPGTAHPFWPWTVRLMDEFARADGTPVVRLDRLLCRGGRCDTARDGVSLYRDASHLSRQGSIWIGRQFDLGARLWRDAR